MRIYIGNLSYVTAVEDLKKLFAPYGTIEDAFIVKDRATDISKGFGFIDMPDEQARAAIKALSGTVLAGRKLRINEAAPKK